jgi:NTE family protein
MGKIAPTNQIVLVLQGGGALGAYQAGVYEALAGSPYIPHWVAGVSIGAINAALIAGNPPHRRVARLREFWHRVSARLVLPKPEQAALRTAFNGYSAWLGASLGVPGFYRWRSLYELIGQDAALSFYDTTPLRHTLEELIDFDLLNSGIVRLSLGAVNVRTGRSVYFDSTECEIRPEHIMASGALPPAFAPVEIGGELYWDGGIACNTPLLYVLERHPADRIQVVLQVDLFSAGGEVPANIGEVLTRHKDIQYASRTRFNTEMIARLENLQMAVRDLIEQLPARQRALPKVSEILSLCQAGHSNIVQLIYQPPAPYTLESKDYEFSRASIEMRWASGRDDLQTALEHPEWLMPTKHNAAVTTFDLQRNPVPGDSNRRDDHAST